MESSTCQTFRQVQKQISAVVAKLATTASDGKMRCRSEGIEAGQPVTICHQFKLRAAVV